MWLVWAVIWAVAARRTKRTRWRESIGSRLLHVVPLLACAVLLAAPRWLPPILSARVVPAGRLLPVLGALMIAAGLGFAAWARAHLGRNWSGIVTVKEDHALVRTGPYQAVRHPIYTGMLFALIGTAMAIGEWRGVLAVVFALIGFLWKIHVEEKCMRENFLEYNQYRRQTAALIPLLY
ncbi:MAG: isoprenylcysteine carboxylmethyltransferase family protein [Alphaproteobacteria bacterium]|nr:isoprenylcysteine carboxylmethyltransferase family protein [Alphaproteobacteria bacterium]